MFPRHPDVARFLLLGCLLTTLTLVTGGVQAQPVVPLTIQAVSSGQAFFFPSPYRARVKTSQFLDTME